MLWVLLTLVDLTARIAIPGSILFLASGEANTALIAATLVNFLAVFRGVLSGIAVEGEVAAVYAQFIDASSRMGIMALRSRSEEQQVVLLLSAADAFAMMWATAIPQIAANVLALLLLGGVILWRLGLAWIALGAVIVVIGAGVVFVAQRLLRRTEGKMWKQFGELGRDLAVVLDAAAELRAHACGKRFSEAVNVTARGVAKHRRRAATVSALVGLLPMGIALVAAVLPLRGGFAGLSLEAQSLVELGVLGGTGLVLSFGLARGVEAVVRTGPARKTLAAFLDSAPIAQPPPADTQLPALDGDIVFDEVTIRYPGSEHATPWCLSHRWPPRTGMALLGDNGAGKTSIVLALLGLIAPTDGDIVYGGVPHAQVDWESFGEHVTYLPQHPYVAEGATIEWHLRLLAPADASRESLVKALQTVGLEKPLDTLTGKLSGGERRRLQLARAFVPTAQDGTRMVVLDEPEAGLDRSARVELNSLIGQLAARQRVLVIAHDTSVIPDNFVHITCVRS